MTKPKAKREAMPISVEQLDPVRFSPPISDAHPAHYATMSPEPIDVIADWEMNFNRGAVIKHVSRAGRKLDNPALKDLKKARAYLQHEIERLERQERKR